MTPKVFMIGGPNGAGKTTAAMLLLPQYLDVFEFVNADEIARGINPLKPETADIAAGRVMIGRIRDLVTARKNFAFETTCAGHHHVATLNDCRAAGYQISVVFYWLPLPEEAIWRVKRRVKQGGHNIPEATIRRRYFAGLKNLVNIYLPLVDLAVVYNNSNYHVNGENEIIASKIRQREELTIVDSVTWQDILTVAARE